MKALILAAGLGTRLRPHTEQTPKPLFTIDGVPLLDRIIHQLHRAGCSDVIVNTHHLYDKIETHLRSHTYPIPVHTRCEPVILGTGGAVRNIADFLDDTPFIVINSDIVTDIDLGRVYAFHCNHTAPVTLVLTDNPEFNIVSIDAGQRVTGFGDIKTNEQASGTRTLTFTGIQVIDPKIISLIPKSTFVHSIDVYCDLIAAKTPPKAYIADKNSWEDIGTAERYRNKALEETAIHAFRRAFGDKTAAPMQQTRLAGDGSDRRWHRLSMNDQSLILADHGIRRQAPPTEIDAFIAIGTHLYKKGVPVPKIHRYDSFSGMVFLEDLGDNHLQTYVKNLADPKKIERAYRSVIDHLIHMGLSAIEGFDLSWTYQTARYNKALVLEKECRYFVAAFLNGWLKLDCRYDDVEADFQYLADNALAHAVEGFMHRDFQSRNIMVRDNRFYIIDFQGGRLGPMQYDLASLLMDPYVALPLEMQASLLAYAIARIRKRKHIDPARFTLGYQFCRVTRNLQALGAFGYLSRVKKKPYFEQYIPTALTALNEGLSHIDDAPVCNLKKIVKTALNRQNKEK